MVSPDASSVRQAIAEKYRKVAKAPEGLFKYPSGEMSALGLKYPAGAVARKVFLAMLNEAGFVEACCVGAGAYRTSAYTQATFYTARKPS